MSEVLMGHDDPVGEPGEQGNMSMQRRDFKAVVLLSGGIDSTTCLAKAVEIYGAEDVLALTVLYGQKHFKEVNNAIAVATHYGVKHIIKELNGVFDLATDNPLLVGGKDIVHESYAAQLAKKTGTVDTYVPFRNGLLLSYATAIAYSVGATLIVYGAHADDAAGRAYPDCTTEFYSAMNAAIKYGTGGKVRLYAPLIHWNKAAVVEEGLKLGAPYELTWSCYEGGEEACGTCGTCLDRQAAFIANGRVDPIKYKA